ncbi:MAG: ABC transporter permease [Chloroflexi bacterium]|nr:ABC transporter permease [Chloroflexota bacterium]
MATIAKDTQPQVSKARKPEDVGQLSQRQLIWRRFKKNRLSIVGAAVLIVLYLVAIFADFVAPYDPNEIDASHQYAQPSTIVWVNGGPAIQGMRQVVDSANFQIIYLPDPDTTYPIRWFVNGSMYLLWGFIPSNLHLFGVESPGDASIKVFLWGADRQGRDVFSRVVKGAQVSLTIGFFGVLISMVIGSIVGTASGYFGGWIDNIIQRVIELIQTFPFISLFVAIAAALPVNMPVVQRYLLITMILALITWTGFSREVRGKVLSYRNADYTAAAIAAGASHWRVITTHMIPNALSHIIVVASFAVPGAIAAETALSFLNLGMLPPAVSWGVLLQDAQQIKSVTLYPWLLIPLGSIVLASLCLYLLGDGLRDAVDPYA